jgi:hypothetical protein
MGKRVSHRVPADFDDLLLRLNRKLNKDDMTFDKWMERWTPLFKKNTVYHYRLKRIPPHPAFVSAVRRYVRRFK